MVIAADTPYLGELTNLGNYLMLHRQEDDAFEALYLIVRAELSSGMVRYEHSLSSHVNVVYAAGQGVGDLRNLVTRENSVAVSEVGRVEGFVDARDVNFDDYTLLGQRADAALEEASILGSFIATSGQDEAPDESLKVFGVDLLDFCRRRIVLPPPGTTGTGGLVDISGAAYDSFTGSADVAMKHFTDEHLINPNEASRKVANFVNGAAIPALASLTYDGRFETVLAALQEIGRLSGAGFQVTTDAGGQFEFQVLPRQDRTIDSSRPVVFRNTDLLVSVPGRTYREDWDIGDQVTLVMENLGGGEFDLTITEVTIVEVPETPQRIQVTFDTPTADDVTRLQNAIKKLSAGEAKTARA